MPTIEKPTMSWKKKLNAYEKHKVSEFSYLQLRSRLLDFLILW